jgi:hypothetical protein
MTVKPAFEPEKIAPATETKQVRKALEDEPVVGKKAVGKVKRALPEQEYAKPVGKKRIPRKAM